MSLRKIADYTITRKLGQGGMGTVYQALSPEGATVAVKTVLWPEVVDPRARWEAIERFQREARAARSLSHPNICQVLDFGADEDSLYIVMEFLDGDTVGQLIDLAGKIEPERAVQITREVGEALAHAHDRGIIHRDVKPGNIMVLRTGRAKLTDFGVASVVRETGATRTGETMGTLLYMSPEQVRGEKADARSDIFSLGATLYEMVTGTRAFQGETHAAVIRQILDEDPPSVEDAPTARVSHIVERCLQKEPQKRFQSARELIDSLYKVETESTPEPTATLGEGEPEPAARARRRLLNPLRALRRRRALVVIAAVAVAAAALLLLRGMRSSDHMVPPSLGRLPEGYVATYLYKGAGPVGGLAATPDGTLLVTAGTANPVPPGVYVARPGDYCDSTDAYALPGPPFQTPGGIARRADGQVLVADAGANALWAIRRPGDRPRLLTDQIRWPADVVVAPSAFDGAIVDPGDALVCVSRSDSPDSFGLYIVDGETSEVHPLAGPPELQNGLVRADFGPDGKLYAVEDDTDCDGLTILSISPNGEATTILENFRPSAVTHPSTGPLAVDPVTGDVLFAYRSRIYRITAHGGSPEQYAEGDGEITALEFSPDGSSLFVDGLRDDWVVKIAPRAVEGRLLVAGYCEQRPRGPGSEAFCYVMSGASDTPVPVPIGATQVDLSPLGDEVAYLLEDDYPAAEPWRKRSHIYTTDLRGSSRANLTESMGPGSINCQPMWSPDRRKISFLHCLPERPHEPCATGLDVWVMNADGTDLHLVGPAQARTGLGSESCPERWWSADGDRLLYSYGPKGPVMSVKADGTDAQALDILSGNNSPDGSKIVDEATVEDVVDGEPGVWRQLYVADADGQNRRVVCQQFVKDRDVIAHLEKVPNADPEDERFRDDVREWIGPRRIKWSPTGERVAFLAARPFDPDGRTYYFQAEVWTCEISTGALTRLTENAACEDNLSWRGPSTRATGAADEARRQGSSLIARGP